MYKLQITASSNVGLVRTNNEDMILVRNKYIRDEDYSTGIDMSVCDRLAVCVADGMGGYEAGEVASQEVLSSLHFFLSDMPEKLSDEEFNDAIVDWLNSINNVINSKGKNDDAYHNMGTTLVGLLFYEGRVYWINCGDSRIYRFRNGTLEQLSTDHSFAALYGDQGHTNAITNCIGAGCTTTFIDMQEITGDILVDDVFLICSDGMTDMVDDCHIERLLDIDCNASQLCHAAIDAGGYDNCSSCVVKIV